jgi:hypothetical protein
LRSILAGPLLLVSNLTTAGVMWPTRDKDRKPRYDAGTAAGTAESGQLRIDTS